MNKKINIQWNKLLVLLLSVVAGIFVGWSWLVTNPTISLGEASIGSLVTMVLFIIGIMYLEGGKE